MFIKPNSTFYYIATGRFKIDVTFPKTEWFERGLYTSIANKCTSMNPAFTGHVAIF